MIGLSAKSRDWGMLLAAMLLGMLLLGFPAISMEANSPFSTSFVEDPTGKMTLDQVRRAIPTPYRGLLSKGMTRSTFWIRIDTSIPLFEEAAALTVRPVHIEEVTLFDPEPGKEQQVLGLSQPFIDGNPLFRSHTFLIQPQFQRSEYWLRLRSRTALMVNVDIQPLSAAMLLEKKSDFFYAAYLGFMCVLIVLVLVAMSHFKEFFVRIFFLYQVVSLIGVANHFGFLRLWLMQSFSPEQLVVVHQLCVVSIVVVSAVFNFLFLRSLGLSRLSQIVCLPLIAINISAFGMIAFGFSREALVVNNTLLLAYSILFLILSFLIPKHSPQHYSFPKAVIIAYYALLFSIFFLMLLPILGIGSNWHFYNVAYIAHSFSSNTIMFSIMYWILLKRKEIDRIRILVTERELHTERESRQSQTRLVSMLSHELKTPLFSIRTAIKRGNSSQDTIKQAVHDMSLVLERTALMNEMEDHRIVPRIDCVDLAQVVIECLDRCQLAKRVRPVLDDLPTIQTDSVLLKVILSNLIDNALKYSPPESMVEISASHNGAGVCLIVENEVGDAGRPEVEKVFSKYYRSPMTRQTGSGLGLYVIKGLSTQLGGELNYAPTSPKVRFELWLPR